MKKLLSVVLVITMLIGGFPLIVPAVTVSAEEEPPTETPNNTSEAPAPQDDYIYYSDLFYNYSTYLNSTEIRRNNTTAQAAMNKAYNEYLSSPNFVLSAISEHINLTTNLPQLFRDYSDLIAETEFRYNDSLDAANIKFVSAVLSAKQNKRISDIQDIGKDTKEYNQILNILSVGSKTYEKLNDVIKTLPEIKYYSDSDWSTFKDPFDFALDYLKPSSIALSQKVPSLKSGFISFSTVLKSCSTAKDIYDLFYSLIISICMEDMRMSLIEDIISTQTAGSVLYEGMTRLKTQLSGGWASNFLRTYFENKLINQVFSVVSEKFTMAMMEKAGALCTSLQNPENYFHAQNMFSTALTEINTLYTILSITISLINTAIFNWILGVPSPKDYQVAMILAQYSTAMFDGLITKQSVFQSPFNSNEIEKYEALFDAYSASINCALDACGELESNLIPLSSETKAALNFAKSLFSEKSLYSDYIDGVIQTIKAIPVESRIITDYGTWTLSNDFLLSGPSDIIENGVFYANNIKANIETPSFNNNGLSVEVISSSSPSLEGNFKLQGRYCSFVIPENSCFYVNGSVFLIENASSGTTGFAVQNDGTFTVAGDLNINGSYSYYLGGEKGVAFTNNGELRILGNCNCNTQASRFNNNGIIDCVGTINLIGRGYFYNNGIIDTCSIYMEKNGTESYPYYKSYENSKLSIVGDLTVRGDEIYGTIIFNGSRCQNVTVIPTSNSASAVFQNIIVTNPEGIQYGSIKVCGDFILNNNPLTCNYTQCMPGCMFDEISDYGNLYLTGEFILTQSIKADLFINNQNTVIIPTYADIVIDGNLYINESKLINNGHLTILESLIAERNYEHSKTSVLENNGTITIFGEAEINGNGVIYNNSIIIFCSDSFFRYHNGTFGSYYGRLVMDKNNSVSIFMGDLSFDSSSNLSITDGLVHFSGNSEQLIYGLIAPKIIIDNTSDKGVTFCSHIRPSVLFNHQQNHFTLSNGGTFVDYDGDGLLDNVDPYPTIGNPCTISFVSDNIEQGTVSIDSVETIGGTEVTVTATPTYKYEFSKWIDSSEKTLSTDAEYTFVAKCDQTITAVFAKRKQPITVQTENGRINVVSTAEIESEVSVTVTENAGYIFDETSLKYNGIPIENNKFTMPDEPVTIAATFNRNDAYFSLKAKIDEAAAIKYNDYSAESFAVLTDALIAARAGLNNHISEQDSQQLITALQSAINGLSSKYPVSISVKNTPTLYLGIDNLREQIVVQQNYDNNTAENVTDYTINGFDCNSLGEQQIEIAYNGFIAPYSVTVRQRQISACTINGLTDLDYVQNGAAEQTLSIVYSNGDVLAEGIDYEIQYMNNDAPGIATLEISGIGNYTGSVTKDFSVICHHQYQIIEDTPATCTEQGRKIEVCTVCGAETEMRREFEDLPQSSHNYSNNMNATYTLSRENAIRYRLQFSTKTQFENNYDRLYLYNANDELLGTYTGSSLSGKTIDVNSSSVKLVLKTDGSSTYYGFSFDYVDVTYSVKKVTIIPELGHAWGDWTNLNENQHQRICSNDAAHIETGNHVWDDGVISVAPTCTEDGEITFTCSDCGYAKSESMNSLGHCYGEWIVSKAPTCFEEGIKIRICGNDENHVEEQILEKLSHEDIDEDGFCDICGFSLAAQEQDEECPYCGEVHSGYVGRIILFFHRIVMRLKQMFGV